MHNVILRQNRISQINLKVHYVFIVEVETAYYVYNYESAYWIKGDIKQKMLLGLTDFLYTNR